MPIHFDSLVIKGLFQAPLSLSIQKEYNSLVLALSPIPANLQSEKVIDFSNKTISVRDLIAYQIGWGTFLLSWYKTGVQGKTPQMPGQGFTDWDYKDIAEHFYKKYHGTNLHEQVTELQKIVKVIIQMVETEYETGNLDAQGIWPWCTLSSGKKWPLSKWIQVNTVAPYKRARILIKKLRN